MDMTVLDLTDHPARAEIEKKFEEGKTVVGAWIHPLQKAEKIATESGTITHELFCGLSHRIDRRFTE
jgi:alanine racemase